MRRLLIANRLIAARLVAIGALVLLAPAPTPAKEDERTPEERVGKEVADLRRGLADKHRDLAKWCKRKKLLRTAHRHLLLALHFGPDHREVRFDLGYKKRDGMWVRRREPDLGELVDAEPPGEAYLVRDEEIRIGRARTLVLIARQAYELGLRKRARELYSEAIRVRPDDDVARQALGHVRIGTRWFTKREAEAVPAEVTVESRPASDIGKRLGLTLAAFGSGNWALESRGQTPEFEYVLAAMRRADGLGSYLLTGGPGSAISREVRLHMLGDKAAFDRYVDGMVELSAGQKAAAKQTGVISAGRVVRRNVLEGRSDSVADWSAHNVGKYWIGRQVRQPKAWLLSGFTDYLSSRVVGTMRMRFFRVEESSGVGFGGRKDRPTPEQARRWLRDMALLEEDPPSDALFTATLTGFDVTHVIKSWSLFAFLAEHDRAALARLFYPAAKGETAAALKQHFGWTPEELDRAWREWIIENG